MAEDRDELKRRRQRREELRRKREKAHRRMILRLVIAGVVLVLCVLLIWAVASGSDPEPAGDSTGTSGTQTAQPVQTTAAPTEQEEQTVIHIAAAGDLNVTDSSVAAGKIVGGYDFTDTFLDVAPVLSNADLAIVNFEGNLIGEPYGSAYSSAPQELMQALADAGVDLVQMANSYAITNGIQGLSQTLTGIHNAGMEPLGAYASNTEAKSSKGYTICQVQGIKVAVVAFTKGMSNLGLPEGSEKCVNLLYNDYATTYRSINYEGIRKILRDAADEDPDFTIALVHWGSEYNEEIGETQTDIRDLMLEEGVDAIIGTHPHLVQTVEYDETAGTLVAYSLGDFFGDGEEPGSNYSIILDLEITRDNITGQTKLTNWSYTGTYNMKPSESGKETLRVVRIDNALEAYELDYFDSITEEAYEDMAYAKQRIAERTSGEG